MNANNSDAFQSIADLLSNDNIPDDEALWRAKALLKMHPNAVREADEWGLTLLHAAAENRGPELCKLLTEMSPDLVRTANNFGLLPVHISCQNREFETVKYLLHSYPESINIPDSEGFCPLHSFFQRRRIDRDTEQDLSLLRFLLQNDRGAVSKPTNSWSDLPLHMACRLGSSLANVKSVYNSYPEAILMQNNYRDTPLDIARRYNHHEVVSCLEIQLGYVRQAGEGRRTSYNHGQLSIHGALQSANILAGTLKLMVAANPSSVTTADNQGSIPIHIACQVGNIDAVKFLMGIDEDCLKIPDGGGNLPLHLACKHGQCEIIPCILEQSAYGVTLQNSETQTPIELLFYEAECDRDTMLYVEAIRCLFQVNPVDILKCLMKSKSTNDEKC
eukprot:scaffold66902_cov23-Cyclotella_meneghiniana.AAC.1